jgi:hypothetical protein
MLQCCTPRNCKGSLYSQVWSMVPHHTLCSTAVLLYAPQTCASWERFVAESLRRVRCRGRDPPRRPSVARVRPFILSLCCKVKNNNENPITALRCKHEAHPQTRVPDVPRSSNARDLAVEGSQLGALLWVARGSCFSFFRASLVAVVPSHHRWPAGLTAEIGTVTMSTDERLIMCKLACDSLAAPAPHTSST